MRKWYLNEFLELHLRRVQKPHQLFFEDKGRPMAPRPPAQTGLTRRHAYGVVGDQGVIVHVLAGARLRSGS